MKTFLYGAFEFVLGSVVLFLVAFLVTTFGVHGFWSFLLGAAFGSFGSILTSMIADFSDQSELLGLVCFLAPWIIGLLVVLILSIVL